MGRLLGAVFGLLKAAIVLGILAVLFTSINNTFHFVGEETLSRSPVFIHLRDASLAVLPYLKNLISKQAYNQKHRDNNRPLLHLPNHRR